MIERLLAGERALADADLETADRLFRQVADADPRNAIAVVGLARVAEARGERGTARELVDRALEIDPEEALARRLHASLEAAAEAAPAADAPAPAADASAPAADASAPAPDASAPALTRTATTPDASAPALTRTPTAPPTQEPARRRAGVIGWLRRLLGR